MFWWFWFWGLWASSQTDKRGPSAQEVSDAVGKAVEDTVNPVLRHRWALIAIMVGLASVLLLITNLGWLNEHIGPIFTTCLLLGLLSTGLWLLCSLYLRSGGKG